MCVTTTECMAVASTATWAPSNATWPRAMATALALLVRDATGAALAVVSNVLFETNVAMAVTFPTVAVALMFPMTTVAVAVMFPMTTVAVAVMFPMTTMVVAMMVPRVAVALMILVAAILVLGFYPASLFSHVRTSKARDLGPYAKQRLQIYSIDCSLSLANNLL